MTIVSKMLSNEIGAVGIQPVRKPAGTGTLQMHQRAVFVRYEQLVYYKLRNFQQEILCSAHSMLNKNTTTHPRLRLFTLYV